MRWEGSAMLRSSPRRTLEAIVTQAISLIVALASDLKALRDEAGAIRNHRTAGQSRHHACEVAAFSRARVAALIKNCGGEVGRSRPPRRKAGVRVREVCLVWSSHGSNERGVLVESRD